MIKKQVKYYPRKTGFIANIPINKKDIKELDINFEPAGENEKGKVSTEDYIILNSTEYNQLNVHQQTKENELIEHDQLKEQNSNLNEKLNNKVSELKELQLKSVDTERSLNYQKDKITGLETTITKLENTITDLQDEIKKHNEDYNNMVTNQNEKYLHLQKLSDIIISEYKIIVAKYEEAVEINNQSGNLITKHFNHKIKPIDKKDYKLTPSQLEKEVIETVSKKILSE